MSAWIIFFLSYNVTREGLPYFDKAHLPKNFKVDNFSSEVQKWSNPLSNCGSNIKW